MKRQGFLLGLFSVGGQVLVLRALVSSLNGDELFIGTALFGWLIAVALGAYWGGKSLRPKNPNLLFVLGAILLPVMVVAVKLSPLMVTSVTGEVVPFVKAAVISILAMMPIGIISGWLFPLITRKILFPASDAVIKVYLYEGIGAFAGGLIIFLLVIVDFPNIVAGGIICSVVVGSLLATGSVFRRTMVIIGCIILVFVCFIYLWSGDYYLESAKTESFEISYSIYTSYGHYLLLKREGNLTLMTDNMLEVTYPDPETAENQFLVPMIYSPSSTSIVYIGQGHFMLASLAKGKIPDTVATVHPRPLMGRILYPKIIDMGGYWPIMAPKVTDPVDYFSSNSDYALYDIVILNSGLPDSYTHSRYFTSRFLQSVKNKMSDSSVLSIPLAYDTDRYITAETQDVLSIIYATLSAEFANVSVWPGTTTIFLASDRVPLDLTTDEIIGRLDEHNLGGDYISDAYLYDRLSEMKVERLHSAISGSAPVNTIDKPILTHYQALYRSTAHPVDRSVISFILGWSWWLLMVPIVIIFLFWRSYREGGTSPAFGLFLYFTAGVVSLSLELISFYLYQTMAGSLYSEMALLIGTFMLGLAVGTYYAHKTGDGPLQFPALIILLIATLIFLTTWNKIGTDTLLLFHTLFLFVVAVATGTLFVGATNIYYGDNKQTNRGLGYAWELAGSALGALLTLTILLPVIGLTWLLISLMSLIVLALAGAIITHRPMKIYLG